LSKTIFHGAERESPRVEHFHAVGIPREGWLRRLVQPLPSRGDCVLAAQRLLAHEDRLVGEEARERSVIPVGHRLRERAFGIAHLIGERSGGGLPARRRRRRSARQGDAQHQSFHG
jgi:hypothetical protein